MLTLVDTKDKLILTVVWLHPWDATKGEEGIFTGIGILCHYKRRRANRHSHAQTRLPQLFFFLLADLPCPPCSMPHTLRTTALTQPFTLNLSNEIGCRASFAQNWFGRKKSCHLYYILLYLGARYGLCCELVWRTTGASSGMLRNIR